MKKPKLLRTMFATYTPIDCIGEGGAGVVYSATEDGSGKRVVIKMLNSAKVTSEKLKRFKNEYTFCNRKKHHNIITVKNMVLQKREYLFLLCHCTRNQFIS